MNKLRWIQLITLILLVGVMAAVTAAMGQEAPSQTLTNPQELDLTQTEPGAIEAGPGKDSSASSIELVSSESISAPARMDAAGVDSLNTSFAPQIAGLGGGSGLNVSVNGLVTAQADEAYVVVIPPTIYGPSGSPQPISSEDRAAVVEKLVALGIAEENIEFDAQGPYGPFGVSAEVQVSELPGVGQLVLDAVEDVIGRSENHGIRFSLSPEKCEEALAQARREAVPQANKTSADLAQALSIERGSVTGATENPPTYFGFGPISPDTCGNQFQDPSILEPFDAEPELEVGVGLQVTYAIEPVSQPAVEP